MAEDTELDLDSLDMPEGEAQAEPTPPAATEPAPAQAAEPAQPRDPATGQFAAAQPAPAAAAPAPDQQPSPIPPADPNANRVVPLAAHLAERRQWQQRWEQGQQELAALNQRIAQLEPKPQAPDFVEDPKGYVDAQTAAALAEVEPLKRQAEELQNRLNFEHFTQELGGVEAQFSQQNPDYYDALGYVRNMRTQQLTLLYPTATPEQVNAAIAQEELQAAFNFRQQGRNPAEVAFQLAAALGYKRAAPPAPPTPAPAAPAAAAAPAAPPIPRAPVADPSNTLGSSAPPTEDDEAGSSDEGEDGLAVVNAALSERFGTRA